MLNVSPDHPVLQSLDPKHPKDYFFSHLNSIKKKKFKETEIHSHLSRI